MITSGGSRGRDGVAQVEIVGGGTSAALLAAWLARSGIRVRVQGIVLSDPSGDRRGSNRRRRER